MKKGISASIFARYNSSISVFDTSLLDNVRFLVSAICQVTLSRINANQFADTCLCDLAC